MAHIHELYDFVVSAWIVNPELKAVLLVDHKALGSWYPIGGHIELDEDPDMALHREIEEECGLQVKEGELTIYSGCFLYNAMKDVIPPVSNFTSNLVTTPWFIDVHPIPNIVDKPSHNHICLNYLATTRRQEVQLEQAAHHHIKWFKVEDLIGENRVSPNIGATAATAIKYCCRLDTLCNNSNNSTTKILFDRPSIEELAG